MLSKDIPEFQQRLIALLLLFIAGFLAYSHAFSINLIPTDSYRLFFAYEKYGLSGIKFNFSDPLLNPVANLLNFFLYSIFGTSNISWITSSLSLHIINAFLLFLL